MRGDEADPRRWMALERALRAPASARRLALALLACAALPAGAGLLALGGSSGLAGAASAHLGAIQVVAALLASAAVLAFERPRSASPRAYARQLAERIQALQATFDADARRQPREGKEQADDHVSSKP